MPYARRALLALLAVLSACATGRQTIQESKVEPREVRMPWPAQTADPPNAPALVAYSALECERQARGAFLAGDTDWGWKALVACTDRADFMDLRPLLHAPWKDELGRRGAEGAKMLGRVLVRTDLELGYDLRRIQNAGIPLLDLKQVSDDPSLAEGQFVILRAVIGQRHVTGGAEVVEAYEQKQVGVYEGMGQGEEGQGGGGTFSPAQVTRMGGLGGLAYAGTGYMGMPQGSGSPLGHGLRSGLIGQGKPYSGWPHGAPFNNDYRAVGPVYENQSVDTGREAVIDLERFDPRLTPGLEIAVLAQVTGASGGMSQVGDVCRSSDDKSSIVCSKEQVSGPVPRLKMVQLWILEATDSDEP
jgi:hypothetical protein